MEQSRKKVLFLITNLTGGGAERVIIHLVNYLDRTKFEPVLTLFQKKGEYLSLLNEDVKIIDLGVKRFNYSLRNLRKIYKVVKNEKPEIFLSTLAYLNFFILICLPFFPKKTTYIARESTIVSLWLKQQFGLKVKLKKILLQSFYNRFDKIIAQSEDMKEDLINNFNVHPKKIVKIHNPVDFDFIDKKLKEKKEILLPENKINLLAVGRLTYQKGFDLLINAFSHIKRDDIHLSILGQGELEEILKQQVRTLNIEEKVSFLGFEENPYLYMQEADVFVLSSRYEGFPNVVLESMACGTPVLANNCKGGINELIKEEVNGLITDLSSSSSEQVISKFLEQKFDADKIKETIADKYSVDRITKQYEDIFEAVGNPPKN